PQIPDYEVLGEVGSGTLGTVFKVLSRRFHDLQALKRIDSPSPELRTRVKRDFRAAARLDHPGLGRVLAFLEDPGALYLTSEYVDGKDVLSFLGPPAGPDPERIKRAFFVFGQALKALAYLHGQDMVHRGLKPSNLLVTREGLAKVLDVGLAREWS